MAARVEFVLHEFAEHIARIMGSNEFLDDAGANAGPEPALNLWRFPVCSIAHPSLPLDRPRRLTRDVIHHAVDTLDLVDDAGRGLAQKLHLERIKIRGHAVGRGHRAQADDVFVGAAVAHHADGLHRQQHGKRLPDLVVEAGFSNLIDIDGVGVAQDVEFFRGDLAGAADGEAGSWERMAADEDFRQAEFAAEHAHLVLEQFAQRLDQLHVHARGQAADIVVRLDRYRWAAGERYAFDHVGIERALRQKIRAADFFGLRVEHVDEQTADGFSLLFGIADACEFAEEKFGYINMHQRDVVVVPEQIDHGLGLVEPQQPVIDEHAGELVADRLVDQDRGDGGIDAAGQSADHLALADLGANLFDRLLAEGAHGPVAGEACDLAEEIADQFRAVGRVHHFGVKHQAVIFALLVLDHGERRVRRDAGDDKARRHFGNAVAMAHPDRMALAHAPGGIEQRACGIDLDIGAAELSGVPALDVAAELRGHGHLAVADAEHGNAGIEDQLRRARRARFVHRFRAAGKDHRLRLHLNEGGFGLLERHDFGIDALLPHPARNQLRHLAAEIDDQNLVMRRGHRRRRLCCWLCGCHGKQLRDGGQARNRTKPTAHMLLRAWTSWRHGRVHIGKYY